MQATFSDNLMLPGQPIQPGSSIQPEPPIQPATIMPSATPIQLRAVVLPPLLRSFALVIPQSQRQYDSLRWPALPQVAPAWPRRAQSLRPGMGLLVIALHVAAIVWLLSTDAPVPVMLAPMPMMVSLVTLPSPAPASAPDIVPVIKRQPVKQPKPTPVKPTPVKKEQPLPVVERITETSAEQPKYSATLAETATAEPSLPASAAAPLAAAASAKPALDEKEEPPKFGVAYLNNPAPEYPRLSKRAGEQGRVLMNVLVTADGLPATVDISKSSGFERLDAAAVAAVKQWRFEPARKGGKAISAFVIVPLSFALN